MVSHSCHTPRGLGFSRTGCNKPVLWTGPEPASDAASRAACFGRTQGFQRRHFQCLRAQVWMRTLPYGEAAFTLYGDKDPRPEPGRSVSAERGPTAPAVQEAQSLLPCSKQDVTETQ